MASGTRLMQEINDQFLHCKICFENFRDPKTLTCLHTFCCSCLQQQYDEEVSNRSTRYSIYTSRQVTCPLCRKKTDLPTGGVRRLPENFLVSNLTQVLAKRTPSKIPPCEICSSVRSKNVDATSKCLDCSKLLCKSCVDLHLATKVTQQHSLIDIEGEKDIECKVHPEENVRFYCEPCDACICVVCAFQEHRDHEVCSLSDGSLKYRGNLETLLEKCKERLVNVGTRLNAIDKYEIVIKDVRERIRDLAINYIAQVRAKEKEMMKHIEDEYGGEIKDFLSHKRSLQENMDELQSTCNLTDIMLKDKGVELLLVKKEIEGKMMNLLEPKLPDVPSEPKYDVSFVPGGVALGKLTIGDKHIGSANDEGVEENVLKKNVPLKKSNQSNGLSHSQTIDPDVITNTTQTDKCKTKEISTSMRSDMRVGFCHTDIQTDEKGLMSHGVYIKQQETRDRGMATEECETRVRGTMTESLDVRSFECQTDQVPTKAGYTPRSGGSRDQHVVPWPAPPEKRKSSFSLDYRRNSGATSGAVDAEVKSSADSHAQRKPDSSAEFYQSNFRSDRAPAPDLLPASAGMSTHNYNHTPARKIRSIKSQTEISTLDVDSVYSSDREFVNIMLQAQQTAEILKKEQEMASATSRLRDRPRRVKTAEVGSNTIHNVKIIPETTDKQTSPDKVQLKDAGVHVVCDSTSVDTQTSTIQCDDSSTCTDREGLVEKCTSTQAISVSDQETSTPVVTSESKVTWTDKIPTSDRATCTVGPKTQHRATGTTNVKTLDMGSLVKPYTQTVTTNTPIVSSSDHESQTTVETSNQGTIPDSKIEKFYADQEKAAAEAAMLDSSVDFMTPPQSPVQAAVQTCDRASDAITIPSFSKSTETVQVKTISSSTETPTVKVVDKDTATAVTKTIDQWTETVSPQLINTGVTPPMPATLDVGVSTNVVLTDEQATCTDIKAFRDTHTETVIVVCESETLTETIEHADAQTGIEVQTESRECETDKIDVVDESSITDYYNPWEAVPKDTQSTQSETPILHTRETNTSRHRRKAKEVQTDSMPDQCFSCGHGTSEDGKDGKDVDMSKVSKNLLPELNKEFKDSSTMPHSMFTQDVGTMAISCVTCHHEFHETAIQTSQPILYDKSSATSFDLDQDFLERALSREYHDAATSTESLPYIGLLSEIDVDELIVVPEAAFELVSDTDSEYDLIMVDDETSTDFLQYVEAGTQTFVPSEDGSNTNSMTESNGSKGVGEIVKSMVESERRDSTSDGSDMKHLVSIGVNTPPKLTYDKETCTPIRHLFSKGTMTFFVSKMDKSTSTFNQARIITGSTLTKTKSADKITMTSKTEKKDVGIETTSTPMDGKITECISKLRNVSERLNSPPMKKDGDVFFGRGFNAARLGSDSSEQTSSPMSTSGTSSSDKPEEERQRQLKTLLEQTNALLKPKDRSPIRKPQPITTLKGRKPANLPAGAIGGKNTLTVADASQSCLQPGDVGYGSKSLPREFSSERPGTVRMGSQPLPPSRLPLLRYNSAPGRIATVPTQTLLKKSGQTTPTMGRSTSPRLSPSKIPITKKFSPPDFDKQQIQQHQQQLQQKQQQQQPIESRPVDTTKPQLRRPLPSITETRTPSSCSDSSTTSNVSAGSNSSTGPNNKTKDSADPSAVSSRTSTASSTTEPSTSSKANRQSTDSGTAVKTPTPSTPSATKSSLPTNSEPGGSSRKSSSDTTHSTSTETLADKNVDEKSSSSSSPKKGGIGFVQRLLTRKKKTQEVKKEPIHLYKGGVPSPAAVAALAAAGPPLPAPARESQAHTTPQFPRHHYPPPPEPKDPSSPSKPRPSVYVQQRLVSIQQDNVEGMKEKRGKTDQSSSKDSKPALTESKGERTKTKDKTSDKPKEKDKEKSKKEEKAKAPKEKEKQKKGEKEKVKAKGSKSKSKKGEGKAPLADSEV